MHARITQSVCLSEPIISNIFKNFSDLFFLFEWLQHVLHAVFLYDLVQTILVVFIVIDAQSDTLTPESTSSSDSMKIILVVWYVKLLSIGTGHKLNGHIKIDDQLDFGDVNTSSQKICGYNTSDLLLSEFKYILISLLSVHVSEN